jgi:TonB-dependent SusC/RagA subfamily outer membrane receptor
MGGTIMKPAAIVLPSSLLRAAVYAAGLLLTCAPALSGQESTGSVTGVVSDRRGTPVVGAEVFLRGTRLRVPTDSSGRFTMEGVKPATYTLVVRHAAFVDQRSTITVSSAAVASADVQLEAITLPVQQSVTAGVVEPLSALRLPFAVGRVGIDQLHLPTGGSVVGALAGKVAGVKVIRPGGQLARPSSLLLRTAISSRAFALSPLSFDPAQVQPLIVLDGIVLSQLRGDVDLDLDAADIESIEVLKGAAAASMYGMHGTAGVIAVTTRRGAYAPTGDLRVDYRVESAADDIGRQLPLSTHHHYRLSADGSQFVNEAGSPVGLAGVVASPLRIADGTYPDELHDPTDALFRPVLTTRHNVNVTRDGAGTTFRLGVNRTDWRGELNGMEGSWRNRAFFNFDQRLGDRFSLSVNASRSSWSVDETGIQGRTPYAIGVRYRPVADPAARSSDGRHVEYPDSGFVPNPLWFQQVGEATNEEVRTLAGATARFSPFQWLNVRAQWSYDRSDRDDRTEAPSFGGGLRYFETAAGRWDAYHAGIAALAHHRFGRLGLRVGAEAGGAREIKDYSEAEGEAPLDTSSWSRTHLKARFRHYMLTLGADYDNRYLFDGVVRRDSSSTYGRNNWQTFYRGALSYRISQERSLQLPGVDELVLRYSIGGVTGGNGEFLRPPHTTEHEVGIATLLLDARLSLDLAYARRTFDDLMLVSLPPSLGYAGVTAANGPKELGSTFEATIQGRLVERPDFTVDIGAVGDRSSHQFRSWPRACFYGAIAEHDYGCKGQQRGDFFGRRFTRSINQLSPHLAARAAEFQVNDEGYLVWVGSGNSYRDGISKQLWGTSMPGTPLPIRWGEPFPVLDSVGNVVYHKLGSSLPDLAYGFTTNVRWKNLNLIGELRGQLGGHVFNAAKQNLYFFSRHRDVDQAGRPDELKKPITYYQALAGGGLFNFPETFVEDATYLKLGALSVRYRLTSDQLARLLGRMAPQELTLGLTGRNLATFTGYSGFDPEAGAPLSRIEPLEYPQLRTIMVTADLRLR